MPCIEMPGMILPEFQTWSKIMLPSQRKIKRKKPVIMAKKALKARRLNIE